MSTLKVDAIVDSSNGNTATINSGTPVSTTSTQVAKAWVNFNGTGTVAIRASYNVSSITDNATGNYTINFTTAMPDVNYAACGMVPGRGTTNSAMTIVICNAAESGAPSLMSTTQFQVLTGRSESQTLRDQDVVAVTIFR
jgi:hypothetical protein